MSDVFVVLCTFPDLVQARQIGTALVEKQLAACVNLIPRIESIYCWERQVHHDEEVLGVLKLTRRGFAALHDELVDLHPYEVPEVLGLAVETGSVSYMQWVVRTVR